MFLNRFGQAVVAAIYLSLTGCAGERLGPEYREIREEESGFQFYAPGLEGGYRQILTGQDEQFIKRTVATFGPKQGDFPYGILALTEMPPTRHFTRVNPPKDAIKEWGPFKDRAITHGPADATNNAIGRVEYAIFRADGISCVFFRQPFGTIHGVGRGTRLLDGYYCRGKAPMMTRAEAEAIVKAVGHRKYGPIEPPTR